MPSYFVPPILHDARSVYDIQHPVHEFWVPCLLHIESPSLAAILFVGDSNGARNDGPVPSLYHTRHQVAARVTFSALEGEGDQVAVAIEPRAEPPADARYSVAVLH